MFFTKIENQTDLVILDDSHLFRDSAPVILKYRLRHTPNSLMLTGGKARPPRCRKEALPHAAPRMAGGLVGDRKMWLAKTRGTCLCYH